MVATHISTIDVRTQLEMSCCFWHGAVVLLFRCFEDTQEQALVQSSSLVWLLVASFFRVGIVEVQRLTQAYHECRGIYTCSLILRFYMVQGQLAYPCTYVITLCRSCW